MEERMKQKKVMSYYRTADESISGDFEQQKEMVRLAAINSNGKIIETKEGVADNNNMWTKLSESAERGEINSIMIKNRKLLQNEESLAEFEKKGVSVHILEND